MASWHAVLCAGHLSGDAATHPFRFQLRAVGAGRALRIQDASDEAEREAERDPKRPKAPVDEDIWISIRTSIWYI